MAGAPQSTVQIPTLHAHVLTRHLPNYKATPFTRPRGHPTHGRRNKSRDMHCRRRQHGASCRASADAIIVVVPRPALGQRAGLFLVPGLFMFTVRRGEPHSLHSAAAAHLQVEDGHGLVFLGFAIATSSMCASACHHRARQLSSERAMGGAAASGLPRATAGNLPIVEDDDAGFGVLFYFASFAFSQRNATCGHRAKCLAPRHAMGRERPSLYAGSWAVGLTSTPGR